MRKFALAISAVSAAMTVAVAGGVTTGSAATRTPQVTAITHAFSGSEVAAAGGYWTKARMLSATAPGATGRRLSAIPNPSHFSGVPTVGALFFTTGSKNHYCTASAVTSTGGDLALTAAHCVYSGSYATHVAYDPHWHAGISPYGLWPVKSITIAKAWIASRNINVDFAFLRLGRLNSRPLQSVTGGLALGTDEGFAHPIHVIGYNDVDNGPIVCATTSAKYSATQMKFFCNDYRGGTSGGPWILNYNPANGTGTVFGDIGGYQQGGNYPYLSYSPYYGTAIRSVFATAEKLDP